MSLSHASEGNRILEPLWQNKSHVFSWVFSSADPLWRTGVVLSHRPAHHSNGTNSPTIPPNFPFDFPEKISPSENLAQSTQHFYIHSTVNSWIEGETRVLYTRGSGAVVPAALARRRRRCLRLILNRASVLLLPVSPPSSARKTWPPKPPRSASLASWRLRTPSPTTGKMTTISISGSALRLLHLFLLSPATPAVTGAPALMPPLFLRFRSPGLTDLLLLR